MPVVVASAATVSPIEPQPRPPSEQCDHALRLFFSRPHLLSHDMVVAVPTQFVTTTIHFIVVPYLFDKIIIYFSNFANNNIQLLFKFIFLLICLIKFFSCNDIVVCRPYSVVLDSSLRFDLPPLYEHSVDSLLPYQVPADAASTLASVLDSHVSYSITTTTTIADPKPSPMGRVHRLS